MKFTCGIITGLASLFAFGFGVAYYDLDKKYQDMKKANEIAAIGMNVSQTCLEISHNVIDDLHDQIDRLKGEEAS